MGQMSARVLSWGLTSFKSIADAQAMDRQYDGSWGTDLVGYGRLAAVAKDGARATTLMTLCFLIFSRAISSVFNAKMSVAAAHLLKFPLPGKKKVFENQRFPLDNVGR